LTAAGHGGSDPGAANPYFPGRSEKVITLEIDRAFHRLASMNGHTVYRMRYDDTDWHVDDIVPTARAVGADVVLEFHVNSHYPGSPASGIESLVYPRTQSENLAWMMMWAISRASGLPVRNNPILYVEWTRFRELSDRLHVLTENGFITSPVDEAMLRDPAVIQAIAWGHLAGIHEYYGLSAPSTSPGVVPIILVSAGIVALGGAILWAIRREWS